MSVKSTLEYSGVITVYGEACKYSGKAIAESRCLVLLKSFGLLACSSYSFPRF